MYELNKSACQRQISADTVLNKHEKAYHVPRSLCVILIPCSISHILKIQILEQLDHKNNRLHFFQISVSIHN